METFPVEILIRIYSHLEVAQDVMAFRQTCRTWASVGTDKRNQQLRRQRFHLFCSIPSCSQKTHEFTCQVCKEPELLCDGHRNVTCERCHRRLGPSCAIAMSPLCVECVTKCEVPEYQCCDCISIRSPQVYNSQVVEKNFFYCSTCDKAACISCMMSCIQRQHEYRYIDKKWTVKIRNCYR